MFLAQRGVPSLWLVLATLVGGTLSAGRGQHPQLLRRPRHRRAHAPHEHPPPVTGTIFPRAALVFGRALTVASTLWLGLLVNWLSAWLALAALVFYVGVYTMLLKRRTAQNIVWGGAAGCMPVLVGWSAVTGPVVVGVVLFAVIFFWTPPHYWPLSMKFKDDYAAAHVPMLPVVERFVVVARQVVAYSWAMVAASLLLVRSAGMGWVYLAGAVLSGALFLGEAHRLLRAARAGAAPTSCARCGCSTSRSPT